MQKIWKNAEKHRKDPINRNNDKKTHCEFNIIIYLLKLLYHYTCDSLLTIYITKFKNQILFY
jgi:hypothetical protein